MFKKSINSFRRLRMERQTDKSWKWFVETDARYKQATWYTALCCLRCWSLSPCRKRVKLSGMFRLVDSWILTRVLAELSLSFFRVKKCKKMNFNMISRNDHSGKRFDISSGAYILTQCVQEGSITSWYQRVVLDCWKVTGRGCFIRTQLWRCEGNFLSCTKYWRGNVLKI